MEIWRDMEIDLKKREMERKRGRMKERDLGMREDMKGNKERGIEG